jgi:hypothetical protein
MLLQARQDWLNCPDPTLWKTGDAHRVLIDVAAPRLTDVYQLSLYGPAVLQTLVDFLDETDRFHPAGMRVQTDHTLRLHRALVLRLHYRLERMRADGYTSPEARSVETDRSTAPTDCACGGNC